MALSRNWIFRISVAGNLFVLVYLALYSTSTPSPPNTTASYVTNNPANGDLPVPSAIRASNVPLPASPSDPASEGLQPAKPIPESNKDGDVGSENGAEVGSNNAVNMAAAIAQQEPVVADDTSKAGDSNKAANGEVDFDSNLNEGLSEQLINESRQFDGVNVLKSNKLFPCDDYTPRSYYGQRGTYWVLYNYFKGTKTFRCDQSITYTTRK